MHCCAATTSLRSKKRFLQLPLICHIQCGRNMNEMYCNISTLFEYGFMWSKKSCRKASQRSIRWINLRNSFCNRRLLMIYWCGGIMNEIGKYSGKILENTHNLRKMAFFYIWKSIFIHKYYFYKNKKNKSVMFYVFICKYCNVSDFFVMGLDVLFYFVCICTRDLFIWYLIILSIIIFDILQFGIRVLFGNKIHHVSIY